MAKLLLFSDHAAPEYDLLQSVVLCKKIPLLQNFVERVSVALREEIRKLPHHERTQIPDFRTINDLIEAYRQSHCQSPVLESALSTIALIGQYIGHFSRNPSDLPTKEDTLLLGLSTGLLAAAAVACANNIDDLVRLGVLFTRLSFRSGALAGRVRSCLSPYGGETEATWSSVLIDKSEPTTRAALEAFHEENDTPQAKQAYISSVSATGVTVSGPPPTIERLFVECPALADGGRESVPICAPYHAKHLFSKEDLEDLLSGSDESLRTHRQLLAVHSVASGMVVTTQSAFDLAMVALEEIHQQTIRLDYLPEALSHWANRSVVNIYNFGLDNLADPVVASLRLTECCRGNLVDCKTWTDPDPGTDGRTQNDKIAIVGMAGRFPNAADHEKLWDLLLKGLDVHRKVPADRFDVDAHYDPSGKGKNKSHTPFGCFIDEPGLFDPRFFNMSPREAAQTDPMGRLALVTAYEALEMSGYVPNRTPSTKLNRIGTFYGQTSDDWREINASENVDTYFITGSVRAFAPGRINYFFKFSGPSFSIDTACSSSLAAIQLACTSLWAGDCDTACAGGLNVLTNPDIFSGLSKGQFLSKTGSCKTYDNDADGYCRGDACGTVILKRYEDAVADKDNILGCILGAATNHSAEAVSITHPHAGAQEYLYKKVLADAGVDAHEISYVEMHGTGTQAGDGIEMTSVTNVFAPPHRRRKPEQSVHLGAIKANVGHAEAASGINSLVKILMMMKHGKIPANVGIKGEMNKSFPADLSDRNVHISQTVVEWPRNGPQKRKVFLNNFSAAGGNTALLLEDAPLGERSRVTDPRSVYPVTVTGRSIASLKRNIVNLQQYASVNPHTAVSSLSYTLAARRIQHNYRVAFPLEANGDVSEALAHQIKDSYSPVPMVSPKVAFCFTGQGSQYTGLGQRFYEELQSFRHDIQQLDQLAVSQGFPSFLGILQGEDVQTLSPVQVQLGMSCIQVALARMWAAWGVKPAAVIGHSLGEYAALHVAGVISASDMVLLVGSRAELLVKECTPFTHGMIAVKGRAEVIKDTLGKKMSEIACINGPQDTVLCGPQEAMNGITEVLIGKGFKATKLNVPFAFHSAQVDPILEKFKTLAASATFSTPSVPIISPLEGRTISEGGVFGPEYLARHARETVDFKTALENAQTARVFDSKTAWLEIGAHPVCSGMVKASTGPALTAPSLRRNEDPWKTIANSVCALFTAGVNVNFDEYHREFNDAQELLSLPTYSFDNKRYWLDYHNSWTLTKGETPQTKEVLVEKDVASAPEPAPKRLSTSCQQVISESINGDKAKVVIRSNLADSKLYPVVCGHLCNNSALCPSSLYADMALTVGDYIYQQANPGTETPGINVCDMQVPKPFIAQIPQPQQGQHIEMEANADLATNTVRVQFRSVQPNGEKIQDHAHCMIRYEDKQHWAAEWTRYNFMVRGQMDMLHQKTSTGGAHKIQRGMAYKLFKALVNYDDKYRAMSEVVLDGQTTEASAMLEFPTKPDDGDFYCVPYHIDGACHISGFICNASDLLDSEQSVYVSHGWGAMKFSRPLTAGMKLRNYVRMQPEPNNVRKGDVYILEGDDIIAVCEGIKFQQIPRRVLNTFLPPNTGAATAPAPNSNSRSNAVRNSAPAPTASPSKAPAKQTSTLAATAPVPKLVKSVAKPTSKPSRGAQANLANGRSESLVGGIMKILAKETEVDESELVDDAHFENLGVDSLLSLTISAVFREKLDMEISSTLFTDYPTVGEMKKYFAKQSLSSGLESSEEANDLNISGDSDGTSTPASSAPSTRDSVAHKGDDASQVPGSAGQTGDVSVARCIVAQEMGLDISEITDDGELAEMGMDSLMSLTILGELRDKTGVDVPATFLNTNPTIRDIEEALGMRPVAKVAVAEKSSPPPATTSKSMSSKKPRQTDIDAVSARLMAMSKTDISGFPEATSVLLQGSTKTARKKVFFLPDGSGSATSYVSIPNIGPDVACYGLNCPFMREPDNWQDSIEVVALVYLAEIKRRQPEGPYIVGGWSAGGVIAYAVAQAILAAGEQVEKLILLDSPCPVELPPLPARFHLFCNEIGLLGTGDPSKTPKWLIPHFAATIRQLSAYDPKPTIAPLPTFAVWCRSGVAGNPGDPRPPPGEEEDPAPMTWLLNHRTDFGDNGWAQLCGEGKMKFGVMGMCGSIRVWNDLMLTVVSGGHHFSMMKDPYAVDLCALIRTGECDHVCRRWPTFADILLLYSHRLATVMGVRCG